ncbi:hypothetical protein Lal_00009276 [Lupinus albus]|uniref:non-specific serine/threonine protein kinase n=1 Tax=Lupinus albus TaxID=3870 RepID=A0A6A5LND8_LUPAL|nr:putative protein kinase RLK-Pelle-PERK-1 family [Lupinus albus]KAF1862896.1 hypothetical protein Lal_00009276 [Lupinus albus]
MASTSLTPNALSPIGVSLPLPITNSSTSPSSNSPFAPPPSSIPPPPTSPPVSQPPLPPAAASAPPQAAITAPPPAHTSPSLPNLSPPPLVIASSPPPPPANVPKPPSTNSPPRKEKPPKTNPSPHSRAPPPSASHPPPDAPPPSTLPSTPSTDAPSPSALPSTPSADVPPPSTLPSMPSNNVPPPSTLPSTPSNDVPPPSTLPSTPSNDAPPPSTLPSTPSNDVPPPSALPSTPSNDVPPPSALPSTPSKDVLPPSTLPSTPSNNVPPPSTLPSTTPPLVSSPPVSLPGPATNKTAAEGPTVSLPSIPTEKPNAKPTNGNVTDGVSTKTTSSHSGGLNTGASAVVGITVGFLVLSLLFMTVRFVKKKKKKERGSKDGFPTVSPFTSSHNSGTSFLRTRSPAKFVGSASGSGSVYPPPDPNTVGSSRSCFTYEELTQATNGFSAQNMLGEGGFGCVYKGLLVDGREVAVKQLKIGGGQGEREFRAEVEIISRVHHRHLVSLVGYCISKHQRLLVYDYLPNDTLHYHLHGENRPVLDWPTRVKVAAGAARGIAYLHEDCHPRIIHRDIKSSNILLDQNFEARVSDFGLAKLALDTYTHITTRVMGTFGYMAPEYATSGKLTEKSDVYSFGVVLLELITGRKPVDTSQPIGDESLVEWARPLLTEALESEDFEILVDSRLGKDYNRNGMFQMIEAAAACVRHSAVKRPKMSQVVRALDSLNEFPDLNNGLKPGQSSVFDSAQQSAHARMFRRMAFGSQGSSSIFNESQSSWRSREQEDSNNMFPQKQI